MKKRYNKIVIKDENGKVIFKQKGSLKVTEEKNGKLTIKFTEPENETCPLDDLL